jgi:hypothetical protein
MIIVNRNSKKPSNAAGQIRIFVSLLSLLITKCCICPCTHCKACISTSRLLYIGLYALCILSTFFYLFIMDPCNLSAKSTILIRLQILYIDTLGRDGQGRTMQLVQRGNTHYIMLTAIRILESFHGSIKLLGEDYKQSISLEYSSEKNIELDIDDENHWASR